MTIMFDKSELCKYTGYNEFNFKEKKHLDALWKSYYNGEFVPCMKQESMSDWPRDKLINVYCCKFCYKIPLHRDEHSVHILCCDFKKSGY